MTNGRVRANPIGWLSAGLGTIIPVLITIYPIEKMQTSFNVQFVHCTIGAPFFVKCDVETNTYYTRFMLLLSTTPVVKPVAGHDRLDLEDQTNSQVSSDKH